MKSNMCEHGLPVVNCDKTHVDTQAFYGNKVDVLVRTNRELELIITLLKDDNQILRDRLHASIKKLAAITSEKNDLKIII